MASLIEEMQREAVDPSASIATLLRKMKFAASKLGLPDLETWVDQEMNGYSGREAGPDYRKLKGRAHVLNGWTGQWQRLNGDPEVIDILDQAWCGQSIAEIESLIDRNDNPSYHVGLGAKIVQQLNESMGGVIADAATFVSREQLLSIVQQVRNRILDWALAAEKNGILGEGYQFNEREKAVARADSEAGEWHVRIENFAGVFGPGSVVEHTTITQAVNERQLFASLLAAAEDRIDVGPKRDEIVASIIAMQRAHSEEPGSLGTAYISFLSSIADHMQVFGPFLTALAVMVSQAVS